MGWAHPAPLSVEVVIVHIWRIALVVWMIPVMVYGGEPDQRPIQPVGYVDADRDGINDRFVDADGDGINDITKKSYPHRFPFKDADRDRVNDLFVDRDGDGVNDREGRFVDRDRDGICDNVVDHDGNGVNDITGFKYTRKSLGGYRYGLVNEERGVASGRFIDENGNGIHDLWEPRGKMHDYFIDEDGDGICDGRGFWGRGRGMMKRRRGRMVPGRGPHRRGGKKR